MKCILTDQNIELITLLVLKTTDFDPTCSWSWASVLCRCWAADRPPEGASALGPAWLLVNGGRPGPLSTTREPEKNKQKWILP